MQDWDEYLNIHGECGLCFFVRSHQSIGDASRTADVDNDSDFNPQTKHKTQASLRTEVARGEMHTLTEHHEHLLSASFDLSYHGSGGDPGPSSSQLDTYLGLDSNFLKPPSDELLDFGGLADELEKELGWGLSQAENKELLVRLNILNYINTETTYSDLDGDIQMGIFGSDMNFNFEVGETPTILDAVALIQDVAEHGTLQSMKRKKAPPDSDKGQHIGLRG